MNNTHLEAYKALQSFTKELISEADQKQIQYQVYWYSPDSRKSNPKSKIGYYNLQPVNAEFAYGCKCVITFPRLAFDDLETTINKHLSLAQPIQARDDYKCPNEVGFDVYQRVKQLKLFIQPQNFSSSAFTAEGMLKKDDYWFKLQETALQEIDPPLTAQEIALSIDHVSLRFKAALAYLQSKKDPKAKLRVRRISGVAHQMRRIDLANTKTDRHGFNNLVLVFGTYNTLPKVDLPKEPNPTRKARTDSISNQYKANPSLFKYYDKFGIFEIYDK